MLIIIQLVCSKHRSREEDFNEIKPVRYYHPLTHKHNMHQHLTQCSASNPNQTQK